MPSDQYAHTEMWKKSQYNANGSGVPVHALYKRKTGQEDHLDLW